MRQFRTAAQTSCVAINTRADYPRFSHPPVALRVPPGYKVDIAPITTHRPIMSAKFYFYFFWYLRPLADREE
ncbi:hypothetical protein bpln_1g05980 [Burkholderia plantarii]|nr:hypothetical protein bpln_1g05980 [Burkholderia plantarii]